MPGAGRVTADTAANKSATTSDEEFHGFLIKKL